jgi:hypothetical protein
LDDLSQVTRLRTHAHDYCHSLWRVGTGSRSFLERLKSRSQHPPIARQSLGRDLKEKGHVSTHSAFLTVFANGDHLTQNRVVWIFQTLAARAALRVTTSASLESRRDGRTASSDLFV